MSGVVAEVVDRHVEEAAILWCRRDRAVGQPHFRLEDLARLDEQLAAQLDGLRVAELDSPGTAWSVCERELRWQEPGEVFAAIRVALESDSDGRLQRTKAAAAHCYGRTRAFVSGVAWAEDDPGNRLIDRWLKSSVAFERRVAIAVAALQGRDPEGALLDAAIASGNRSLSIRALRAVGELARRDLLPLAREEMRSDDFPVGLAAAWSVARLTDDATAAEILRAAVETNADEHGSALHLVLRRMQPSHAAAWIKELARNPRLARQAVIGSGIVGLPESMSWLLHSMQTPALARVAGEAFATIAGLDFVAEKLEGHWPIGFAAGPNEDPRDDNVAMDEDENLPWPDVAKLTAWWEKNSSNFPAGVRLLCGKPLTDDWLATVLRHGYQRQRAAAALEMALMRPDQRLFNVRAPGNRQQELLGLL